MKSKNRITLILLAIFITCTFLIGITGGSNAAKAQSFSIIHSPEELLVLKAQGSFFVGGELIHQNHEELGGFVASGDIVINQMYVQYMIPQYHEGKIPVVMIHGMALTGKTWDTTPDGRMGWFEYFTRQGYPVFLPDQVGRGRSGFNQAVFNQVRTGVADSKNLPAIRRFSNTNIWPNFRLGPEEGVKFPDTQFPVDAVIEFAKQGVPDLSGTLPGPNPNFQALSELAIELDGALLISHSQSGVFPLHAALIHKESVKGVVMVEPGGCPSGFKNEQIEVLSTFPTLIIYGDYLDNPTGVPHSWQVAYEGCLDYMERVNNSGGNVKMWYLPEMGISGSSHMLMQDENNLQIADMIINWIEKNLSVDK